MKLIEVGPVYLSELFGGSRMLDFYFHPDFGRIFLWFLPKWRVKIAPVFVSQMTFKWGPPFPENSEDSWKFRIFRDTEHLAKND